MIQIIADSNSPRLTYVLDFVFNQILTTEYRMIAYDHEVIAAQPTIYYTDQPRPDKLSFRPSGILTSSNTVDKTYLDKIYQEVQSWTNHRDELHAMDVFGIIFCYLSRYEEYFDFNSDRWNRFLSGNSLFFKLISVEPVVDQLIILLKNKIEAAYPDYVFPKNNHFRLISTIDIDQAWAYQYKGWRNIFTLGKACLQLDFKRIKSWFRVLVGNEQDPFDTYTYIKTIHEEAKITPIYFILLSDKLTAIDRNHHPTSQPFQSLIKALSSEAPVGIHPSWHAHQGDQILHQEIKTLQRIIGQPITASRQHFLIMQMPQTYHKLLNVGIQDDYTMGFADSIGYRAGTGHDFYWYDLQNETTTTLRLHPFMIMDVSMKNYLKLNADQAIQKMNTYKETAQKHNSPLTILWHNSSLDEAGLWKGWKGIYERFIKEN